MPGYELIYFNAKGRAELSRYMFALGGVPYKDTRFTDEEWKKTYKPSAPFGQAPLLKLDNGVILSQSNSIARYLAKKFNLAGKNDIEQARADMIVDCGEDVFTALIGVFYGTEESKAAAKKKFVEEQKVTFLGYFEKFVTSSGYLVGNQLTWADCAVVLVLEWVNMASPIDYKKYPGLNGLNAKVNGNPKIAQWIKSRPKTDQ